MIEKFIYEVDVDAANPLLGISDRTFTYNRINTSAKETHLYVEFFDADGTTPITPTAGVITIVGSPMGNVFLSPSAGGVIDCTAVATTGTATYDVTQFIGTVRNLKFTFSGVTGATYCKIAIAQFPY